MAEALTEQGGILVGTETLASEALPAGGTTGNTSYDVLPTDGTVGEAPDSGSEVEFEPAFTMSSFTVYVATAAIMIRISVDGTNYGNWIYLAPGSHAFDMECEIVQLREAVNAGGGQYVITGFA